MQLRIHGRNTKQDHLALVGRELETLLDQRRRAGRVDGCRWSGSFCHGAYDILQAVAVVLITCVAPRLLARSSRAGTLSIPMIVWQPLSFAAYLGVSIRLVYFLVENLRPWEQQGQRLQAPWWQLYRSESQLQARWSSRHRSRCAFPETLFFCFSTHRCISHRQEHTWIPHPIGTNSLNSASSSTKPVTFTTDVLWTLVRREKLDWPKKEPPMDLSFWSLNARAFPVMLSSAKRSQYPGAPKVQLWHSVQNAKERSTASPGLAFEIFDPVALT